MALRLTRDVFEAFGNRKRPGTLSIIVDLRYQVITPVPRNVEHIVFVPSYLQITSEEFKANPQAAARIIPVNFIILDEVVTGMVTGVSGIELGLGVRHDAADLQAAHTLALTFLAEGDFTAKLSTNKIIFLK